MKRPPWLGAISASLVIAASLVLAGTQTAHLSSSTKPSQYVAERIPIPSNLSFLPQLLNDQGQAIGVARPSKDDPVSFAFKAQVAVWDGKRVQVLPGIEGFAPKTFNNQGQALIRPEGFAVGAVVWSKGALTAIPIAIPEGMNNKTEVVGDARVVGPGLDSKSYLWSKGKLVDITFGRPGIRPYSINDKGQIVGLTYERVPAPVSTNKRRDSWDRMMDAVRSRGTVWLLNPGTKQWQRTSLLDNMPGTMTPGAGVESLQVNNNGQILISLFLDVGKRFRFQTRLWDRGRVQKIGPPSLQVVAKSMNDAGQVVGKMSAENQCDWTPFIWQGGAAYDLNTLLTGKSGIKLTEAMSINNKGWILCGGTIGHDPYDFILRPAGPSPAPTPPVTVASRAALGAVAP